MGWGANTLEVDYMNRKTTVQFFNDETGLTLLPVVVDVPVDAPSDWFQQMVTDRIIQLDQNSRAMVGITEGFVIPDVAKLEQLGITVAKNPADVIKEVPVGPEPAIDPKPIGG